MVKENRIFPCQATVPATTRGTSMENPAEIEQGKDQESGWIASAQGGDLAAFSKLVVIHQVAVRAFLVTRLSRKHEADDLAQETFVTAWRKMGEYDAARPFGPWLRGIAEGHLRNHLRKFRAEPIGGDEALQMILDQATPGVEEQSDRIAALGECVEKVDLESRELLIARYSEGRSMQELCERSGSKHSAVTMKLHRLRLALAACVEARLAGMGT